jgi:lon-related putative ATP-dependent protease
MAISNPPPNALPSAAKESMPADWTMARPLPADRLYRRSDLSQLAFTTSTELPDWSGLVGQERATTAIGFALSIRRHGFNLFVLGPAGTGKQSLVQDLLRRQAAREPRPADWCYVNNFADARRPRRLQLPAGRGAKLSAGMRRLVSEIGVALPAAFEREDYRARRDIVDHQFKQRHEDAFGALQQRAEGKGAALIRTPLGLALAPTDKGEVLGPDDFAKLPEAEQARRKADIKELQEELEAIVRRIPDWEREHRQALRHLNRDTTTAVVSHLLGELREANADLENVLTYLDEVQRDVLENVEDFLHAGREGHGPQIVPVDGAIAEQSTFRRYQVNVMVDNSALEGAPIVYEDRPNHQSLVGHVEHMAKFGALFTDFNLIVPGALHRANGGYLILDAQRLLTGNFGWESLKRALQARELRIESLEQMLSLASTVSLEPEPIPLDVKVVLTGPPMFYYLLSRYDPDFPELFKVAADFEDRVARTPESTALFAQFIAVLARREKLRPLDRDGMARAIEQTSRASGDAERLSLRVSQLLDLLQEADHIAAAGGRSVIGRADIQAAIDAGIRRADRVYQNIHEEIERGTIHVESAGAKIGQMNGLSVFALGGQSFGQPSRITARVRLGEGQVVDIEREVALGGPLHSKGVLILSGFLGGRFGRNGPLSLTASLVFEQSYGGVEGDSASAAELLALLSALAEVPLKQCLAMTGSIDQLGRIQAIGGVNEKIEGFFDVCRKRGLDGSHGVLIPASNVQHLMLRSDVVEAAAAGAFHVLPVETIDQAIEIATGLPAGELGRDGRYPPDSVNAAVAARLAGLAALARQHLANATRGNHRGNRP